MRKRQKIRVVSKIFSLVAVEDRQRLHQTEKLTKMSEDFELKVRVPVLKDAKAHISLLESL